MSLRAFKKMGRHGNPRNVHAATVYHYIARMELREVHLQSGVGGCNEVSNFPMGNYDDYVRDVACPPAMPENVTVLVDD